MKASVLIFALTCTTALAACSTALKSPQEVASSRQQLTGSWSLKEAKQFPEIPADILLTLRKDTATSDNKLSISGFSGVNHFVGSATVDLSQQRLFVGTLASTRRVGPQARMQFEQDFLKQMEQVVSFKLDADGSLILSTLAGANIIFQHTPQ